MAKQHQARGEDGNALKMYELAQPFFPGNEKLVRKIEKLRAKLLSSRKRERQTTFEDDTAEQRRETVQENSDSQRTRGRRKIPIEDVDESYQADENEDSYHDAGERDADDSDEESPRPRKKTSKKAPNRPKSRAAPRADSPDPLVDRDGQELDQSSSAPTPRTQYLIDILNSRSVSKLKALNGLGVKKAEAIVQHLQDDEDMQLADWHDVLSLDVRGIGKRSWEVMREGVLV